MDDPARLLYSECHVLADYRGYCGARNCLFDFDPRRLAAKRKGGRFGWCLRRNGIANCVWPPWNGNGLIEGDHNRSRTIYDYFFEPRHSRERSNPQFGQRSGEPDEETASAAVPEKDGSDPGAQFACRTCRHTFSGGACEEVVSQLRLSRLRRWRNWQTH